MSRLLLKFKNEDGSFMDGGYGFSKGEVVIGRELPENCYGFGFSDDKYMSKMHCKIKRIEGMGMFSFPARFSVEDLGSTNGTWLDERRVVGPLEIKHGQILRAGSHDFYCEITP